MATFTEIETLVGNLLPDNNSEDISPQDLRDSIQAILDKMKTMFTTVHRVTLDTALTYTHDDFKVPTARLLIIYGMTVLSGGPVNDDAAPDPLDWPHPGGATANSWSHDPVTGKIWFPYELNGIIEIRILPETT